VRSTRRALLGIATMSCHTPADNSVNRFVQELIDGEAPPTLDDLVVKLLRSVPDTMTPR